MPPTPSYPEKSVLSTLALFHVKPKPWKRIMMVGNAPFFSVSLYSLFSPFFFFACRKQILSRGLVNVVCTCNLWKAVGQWLQTRHFQGNREGQHMWGVWLQEEKKKKKETAAIFSTALLCYGPLWISAISSDLKQPDAASLSFWL